MINKETSRFYSEIKARLDGVRKKEHRLALVHGVMATLLIMIFLLLLSVVVEEIFSFRTFGRIVLFTITTLGIAASIAVFIVRPLLFMFGFFDHLIITHWRRKSVVTFHRYTIDCSTLFKCTKGKINYTGIILSS